MYNFICENDHDNFFSEKKNQPFCCRQCSVAFEEERVIEVETTDELEVIGLTLIYQADQKHIDIPLCDKIILGREHFGEEVFSNIQYNGKFVVSRKHCSIEFKAGNFYLRDENSLNGTFVGINKINCKDSPGIIEDNGLVFIGREPFLVKFNRKKLEKDKLSRDYINEPDKNIETNILFRCNESGCGYESISFVPVCPKCTTYNSLIRI